MIHQNTFSVSDQGHLLVDEVLDDFILFLEGKIPSIPLVRTILDKGELPIFSDKKWYKSILYNCTCTNSIP